MDLYDTLVASRGELESSSLQLAAPLAASHCTRNNYSTTVGTVCLMGKKLSPSSNLGWPQAVVGFRTDSKWAIFSFVTWARSGASSALFHRPYPHVVGKWCREHLLCILFLLRPMHPRQCSRIAMVSGPRTGVLRHA